MNSWEPKKTQQFQKGHQVKYLLNPSLSLLKMLCALLK